MSRKGSGIPASGLPASGVPARGVSWVPFQPGNQSKLTHGAMTQSIFEPLAEQLAAGIIERRPDLALYPEALAGWATAEAQAILLRRYSAEHGLLDDKGEPRGFTKLMTTVEQRAERARATLGLDPTSEAKLTQARASASVLAVNLEQIAEAGRQVLEHQPAEDRPADVAGQLLAAKTDAATATWEQAFIEQNGRPPDTVEAEAARQARAERQASR